MSRIVIGVDISKLKFDATILFENNKIKQRKFDNTHSGFKDFIKWIKLNKGEEAHICMEATGVYGDALATFLYDSGITVSMVNPLQIKGFAQSMLSRNKTDQTDATLIAHFCRAMQPTTWQPAPEHVRVLQALVRRLEALESMNRQELNRLGVAPEHIKCSIEAVIKKISEEIKLIKNKIKDHITKNPDLNDKSKLLQSIPGVGPATIMQVLAFIGDPSLFDNAKKLSAFVGLNPKQNQSGTSINGRTRLSKMGNANLRKAFYMPAVVALRYNPIIKAFSERLKASGKMMMVIIGAAMRKLLHIIYGVLKSGKPFTLELVK